MTPYVCDVSNRAAVFAAIRDFVAVDGTLDALVNNAVYFNYAPLVDMPEPIVDRMLSVGIKGTFWSTQAATPYLIAAGGGAIVNMSSIRGDACDPERGRLHVDQGRARRVHASAGGRVFPRRTAFV